MKILYLIRAVVLLILIIVAFKPVAVRPDPGVPSAWAVLLDTSKSMNVLDPVNRLDQAKEILKSLYESFPQFSFFQFSDEVLPLEKDQLDTVKPKGRKSNLALAIQQTFRQSDYRGALIFTDGRQVGSGDVLGEAVTAGRPLILVGAGNKSLFKDVSVKSIQSPPFAFKNVQTSLSAVISVVGFAGKKVTVKLKQGSKVLGIQTLTVSADDVESTVTFQWTPRSLGTKLLTVEISQYSGEFTTVNNRKKVTLDVGRDRFRVLYICGSPGPEYGFLRHQFKSDPAVELVTFVILRNSSNVLNVPDSELSLIPFPTQDILIRQMASFDLIVFEEFSYERFGLPPSVMFAIRKKVEDGGSFLMMGGEKMLRRESRYNIAGIREMIPVEFGGDDLQLIRHPQKFRPQALQHPILRLSANSKRNKKIWNSLPFVEEITLFPKAKPGATVLATVRYRNVDYPVLTVWKHGKGRVASLATRTTWRFSMLEGTDVKDTYAYQQFWKNMVLWLTHSDQFKSVRIALDKRQIRLGDEAPLRIWAYDEYFKPISDVDVHLQITNPDGEKVDVKAYPETKGVYIANIKPETLGTFRAQAWVRRKGKGIGRDQLKFEVIEGSGEMEDLSPDFSHLKELARATGGQFIQASDFDKAAFSNFDQEVSKKIGKKVLVWNSPWFLIVLLVLFIVEWILRKKRGLP